MTTGQEQAVLNPDKAGWDEATGSKFVKFEPEVEKRLEISDWGFLKRENPFKKKDSDPDEIVEFVATVSEEDGVACEKTLAVGSNPFKKKLRPVLEDKDPKTKVGLSITKVGEGKGTNYLVKEIESN